MGNWLFTKGIEELSVNAVVEDELGRTIASFTKSLGGIEKYRIAKERREPRVVEIKVKWRITCKIRLCQLT